MGLKQLCLGMCFHGCNPRKTLPIMGLKQKFGNPCAKVFK